MVAGVVAGAFFVPPANATAAVTVSAGATLIVVDGTSGRDVTVLSDDGVDVRISNATASGANCTQSGSDALCPRGARTISAGLLGGSDDFDNRSSAEAAVDGGAGADLLVGRLRSATGGDGPDVIRPSGMTGTVQLTGGGELDIYDIGADTGAADVISDVAPFMVDYLSRPAQSGGVALTPGNGVDDDGAAGEFDNIAGATFIRGTVNADNIAGTAGNADVLDGDLGADTINGGDDVPNGTSGGMTLTGDAVVFGMDDKLPYARPAATARNQGITADIGAGTSSDGDSIQRIDDLRGSPLGDVLLGSASHDVIEGGAGTAADQVTGSGGNDVVSCEGLAGSLSGPTGPPSVLAPLAAFTDARSTITFTLTNQCTLTVDAGDGDDVVKGGAGNDIISGGPGTDQLLGGDGADTVSFAQDPAAVNVNLAAPSGEIAIGAFENVIGSPFNDTIAGTAAPNSLDGGDGTDTVTYAGRPDGLTIDLQARTTTRADGTREDTIDNFENATGGEGRDLLAGNGLANVLTGNGDGDRFFPRLGADTIAGGPGSDTLDFGYLSTLTLSGSTAGIVHTMNALVARNSEGDISVDIEGIFGSPLDDTFTGTSFADEIQGRGGNDRLRPRGGADSVAGGAGIDTLDYSNSTVAVHADLRRLQVREFASTATTDTLLDTFENLTGSPMPDVLRGSDFVLPDNEIKGGSGDDVIDGRRGDDVMHGEAGADDFGTITENVPISAKAADVSVGAFTGGNIQDGSSNTIIVGEGGDGRDRVFGGAGFDDINVRDAALDLGVDCGPDGGIARQDLVDDEGDLDVDACTSIETTAIDQRMTVVRSVRKRRGYATVRLACPRRSKVACRGTAGLARRRSGKPRRVTRYRIRKGARRTLTVRGSGRYLVLSERDQRRRKRQLVRRLGSA